MNTELTQIDEHLSAVEEYLPGWYDVAGTGRILLLTYRQVLDRIRDGKLPARKIGTKYIVAGEDIKAYDARRRAEFQVMPDGSGSRGYGQL